MLNKPLSANWAYSTLLFSAFIVSPVGSAVAISPHPEPLVESHSSQATTVSRAPVKQPLPLTEFLQQSTSSDLPPNFMTQRREPIAQFADPIPNTFDPVPTPLDPNPIDPSPSDPTPDEGDPPTLQTVPSPSNQQPFTPTELKFKPPEQFVSSPSPGVTIITPSAYGLPFRFIGAGAGLQSRTRYTDIVDGSFGVGFGLGDPKEAVGLTIGLISFSSFRSGFLERGTVNFKLNRYLKHDIAIAAGVNNGVTWGKTDSSVSPYGVVTKQFILKDDIEEPLSRLYVSAGVGGGQFRSEADVIDGAETIGAFGSVAVRVMQPVSFISEWSGQDLTLGVSIAPFRSIPLVFTPAVTDITGTAGDGSRFIFGVGFGTKY